MPFQQPARARENLARLSEQLPPASMETLRRLVPHLPDGDSAVNNLERFMSAAAPAVREYVAARPAALHHLLSLFSCSQYLADTLVYQPELAIWLEEEPALHRVKATEEMLAGLGEFLGAATPEADVPRELARFKRREYLRIALRDVLRLATLPEVTQELSALADAILSYALERAQQELVGRYGTPMLPAHDDSAEVQRECPSAILSLGKLGGRELNYSSDIDLIFLYRANGETTGGISNKEYFVKLAHRVVSMLTAVGPEGGVFRVDLRLRPEGREGDMAVSLDGARDYYRQRARDWELQALVKARHSAGDPALSRDFLDSVQALIYQTSLNFAAIDSVLFARQRIGETLKRRAAMRLGIDVKLERGGIRDVEFLVQCLQRLYGGQESWLRSGGTMFALQKLADKGYLGHQDFGKLSRAYLFLRNLEHLLQLERGQQTHRLPATTPALGVLARRARIDETAGSLAASSAPGPARTPATPPAAHATAGSAAATSELDEARPRDKHDADLLSQAVAQHMKNVREIYERLVLAHSPGDDAARSFALEPETPFPTGGGEPGFPELLRHIESNCPPLYRVLKELPLTRGRRALQRYITSAWSGAGQFAFLCDHPHLLERAAELFEHSPFLSEMLVRNPDEIAELADLPPGRGSLGIESQKRIPAEAAYAVEDDPQLTHVADADLPLTEKMALMRRHYRRRLLRVHAHSLHGPIPVFSTLEATSLLAEQVIRAAYRAAVNETAQALPRPHGDLIVVALGRLGVREFDIASDADLGFLYHGGDPEAKYFWTRVAERMIEILSSYTGEGSIFAVDTRLRPRGREGELIESEPAMVEYFHSAAEPWEALTYMKSRVVAGDVDEGTVLLLRVQNKIGERFGRGPVAARRLAEMRRKMIESLAGPSNFLKTAPGGYYDIDFILTYLRLQAAQVFFPSLTTLERLRVVEWMGQLRPDHVQVLRDGAILLRGVEHALRVSTGRSDSELPPPGARSEPLTRLAERWLPESARGRPLHVVLEQTMSQVRAVFTEFFGA